ncbi:hypothetical protein L1987_19735 [Smallanthus sonchifolius]|uniref:Uncharacterized protein n=1 Tax=Smallanthus sonchifolius TaxID=185202 RepID=A0ACB9IQM9_9ASTR|nr:hypothetical protein L1987_19735 [Smallanthus sonchifolius]
MTEVTLYQDAHVDYGYLLNMYIDGGLMNKNSDCWHGNCEAIHLARHLIYTTSQTIQIVCNGEGAKDSLVWELLKDKSLEHDDMIPISFVKGIRIRQIASGDSHYLAVTMEHEVQSWGWNQNEQLGLGTTEDSLVPQKIEAFQGINVKMVTATVAITEVDDLYGCGWRHTISVSSSGDLYAFEWSKFDQLEHRNFKDHFVSHKLQALHGRFISQISGG